MHPFVNGVSACGSFVAGLLFFRFWRQTFDRLFGWFAPAFWMFAANWTAIAVVDAADERRYLYFLPRLIGFALILTGIVDRNRML